MDLLSLMVIIYLFIFEYSTIAAAVENQQSKKFDHRGRGRGDDGLLVSSSLLHKPISFASSLNEESVLSGLFKRHKNAIMNRNHALISISHPHYSLYFQPHPPNYLPQSDLFMNSLINPSLMSVMPEYSIVPPMTTMSQLSPLVMRNNYQYGHHQSPMILPNSAIDSSSIYKNIAAQSPITNSIQYQFNGNDPSLHRYRHPNHQNNKHKIQIGQKLSQSIYANNHKLRYENPQMKGKPTDGSRTVEHQYRLPARLSSITKNPYYGILNDDDDDDDENNDDKKMTTNNNEDKRKFIVNDSRHHQQDSKEEKGFF